MTLAQRALTSAHGLLSGAYVAARWLRERVLDVDPMYNCASLAVLGEIVGARVFYLCEHDPGALLVPDRLFSRPRLTVDGAASVVLLVVVIAGRIVTARLSGRDATADGRGSQPAAAP